MSTKDFLEKDYYKALGVGKTAKPAEIKAAYRKLARKYHPDANKGDASAEERFKEISEAYSVLSDEKRRKEYDEARSCSAAVSGCRPGSGPDRAAASAASTSATSSVAPGTRVAAWATCSAACSAAAAARPRRTGHAGAPTSRPRRR